MRARTRRIVSRFTYANVMSTFAVFLILTGGAAYAANTIRSADIVNNQVFSADVRDDTLTNGGLTGADIANDSIGSSELQPASVGSSEVAFGAVSGKVQRTVQASSATDTTVTKEVAVSCTFDNDKVTGGGFVIAAPGANVPNVAVQRSYAVSANTWLVRATASSGTPNWQLSVVANCIA